MEITISEMGSFWKDIAGANTDQKQNLIADALNQHDGSYKDDPDYCSTLLTKYVDVLFPPPSGRSFYSGNPTVEEVILNESSGILSVSAYEEFNHGCSKAKHGGSFEIELDFQLDENAKCIRIRVPEYPSEREMDRENPDI